MCEKNIKNEEKLAKQDATGKTKLVWSDYQDARSDREKYPGPILYPVTIEMEKTKGNNFEFKMERMKTTKLFDERNNIKEHALTSVPRSQKKILENMLDDYYAFFDQNDTANMAPPPGPLDFQGIKRDVYFLVYLGNPNWAFSGFKQFEAVNDDPANPKVRQISTFGRSRGILVKRSAPFEQVMKYDFYVTIYQDNGKKATDIIIDPRDDDDSVGG